MSTWTTTKTRHGTVSGWRFHQLMRERPCEPCYEAKQAYDKRRRETPEQQQMNRLRARAQHQALQELAQRYPEEYRALYEEGCTELGLPLGSPRRRSKP